MNFTALLISFIVGIKAPKFFFCGGEVGMVWNCHFDDAHTLALFAFSNAGAVPCMEDPSSFERVSWTINHTCLGMNALLRALANTLPVK